MAGGDWSGDEPPADTPHPAIKHFARWVNQLTGQCRVERVSGSGKPLKLTPKGVRELILQQAPDVAESQTQLYRYYNGEAAPSIALIFELARLFNVSPQTFLPESAPASTEHYRLRPISAGDRESVQQRQVSELTEDMSGTWLVESQHSRHEWDLDAMTYTRIPGMGGLAEHFVLDKQPLSITRVDRWPRVGSTSLLWFDDPSDPEETEHWRQSSRIVTITEIDCRG